jgi:hypothetical protein
LSPLLFSPLPCFGLRLLETDSPSILGLKTMRPQIF